MKIERDSVKTMAICDAETLRLGLEPPSPTSPSDAAASTTTINNETLTGELDNLKLEEKPEPKSDEPGNMKLEAEPEEKTDSGDQDFTATEEKEKPADKILESLSEEKPEEKAADGCGSDRAATVAEEKEKPEEKPEEKAADGWGSDGEAVVAAENDRLEKDLEPSSEVKVVTDGWGSDRETAVAEENEKLEKDPKPWNEGKVAADGWGSDREAAVDDENEKPEKDPELSSEWKVVADGWGSDREATVAEENEKLEKDLEPSNEVKVDGWGWDQDFSAPDGNEKFAMGLEPSNEEKVDGWGWDQETGGTDENFKSESSREEKGHRKRFPFSLRPNEPDCAYYVKTGTCKYGLACKFNHPPSKLRNKVKFRKSPESAQAAELNENRTSLEMVGQTEHEKAHKEKKRGILSESYEQMDCKYYSTPGGCKFGNACKYNHKEKTEVPAELNFLGLPMRPGEKECTYYMSTGSCKFSTNCRFHHPDPIAVGGQDPTSGYQNVGSSQPHAPPAQLPLTSWPLQRPLNEPAPFLDMSPPYVPGYFLPPQGLHPNPEWNAYQVPLNPLFPAEMSMPSASTMQDAMRKGNGSAPKRAPDGDYPERPGQPECQFFMKTGTCKFKSACKFHHPKSRLPKTSAVFVSPVGLPLRTDQPVCTHYSRHGICKYGRSCKYNHPMDFNPSVMPGATAESTQKVFPESVVESQEVSSANRVQESGW